VSCLPVVVACHGNRIVQVKPPCINLGLFVTLKSGWFEPGTFNVLNAVKMSSAEDVALNNLTTLPSNPRFQAAPGWSPWQLDWPWRRVDTVHFAFTLEFEASL
jgi:hypothetical protein